MHFLILIVIPIFVGLYAQMRIKGAYSKNMKKFSHSGVTGAQAAAMVMDSAGIGDVEIVEIRGHLTDHYDPVHKRLALSSENFRGKSLAALGVAAHEAGHAIQHKENYAPLSLRMSLIPITNIASQLLPIVMFGGFIFFAPYAKSILLLAVGIYLVLTLFQLVTLPVEFNASKRAKFQLGKLGIIGPDEAAGVNETLNAAAFTYVAAFISSLGWLLYFLAASRR